MAQQVRTDGYIFSSMPIKARRISAPESVKMRMESYPGLSLIERGERLRYYMRPESAEDHFYVLRLEHDAIIMELYSRISPYYLMQESLLRISSIARFLSEDYAIDTRSLLPYVTELLTRQELGRVSDALPHYPRGGDSNIILAARINKLLNENRQLKESNHMLEGKKNWMLCSLIVTKYGGGAKIGDITHENRLDRKDVLEALESMQRFGYKVIRQDGERFSMVKL